MEYRKLSDGIDPVKELREWKTLFLVGVPLFPSMENEHLEKVKSAQEIEMEVHTIISVLLIRIFSNYVNRVRRTVY